MWKILAHRKTQIERTRIKQGGKYIKDPELARAKERYAKGEVEIVIVKLEPCACDEDSYLGKLQRLARTHKSIAEAKIKSVVWEQVRKDLLPVIARVREKKQKKR
jgi:hypothetical protein